MKSLLLTLVVVTIMCLDLGKALPNAPESWRSCRTCLCPAWVPLRSRPVTGHSKQCKERGALDWRAPFFSATAQMGGGKPSLEKGGGKDWETYRFVQELREIG
ncbi:long neurotoxin-like OH-31 [Pseudonaja textilis]|uniref:long neurotoxin-like OH-31 n=1 Tax=Pseudonaja textilis TaxID=8673 RepID=UPI000EAAA3E3|nr:long neurotoxin-like OH-31 [Pseudonaja textilis]